MYISAIKYLSASLVTAVFAIIYEQFSHGVVSYFMLSAFLFPLLGGGAALMLSAVTRKKVDRTLYNCGLLTLTVGSITQGILEIYGTTNRLCGIYWIVGIALTVLGGIGGFRPDRKKGC